MLGFTLLGFLHAVMLLDQKPLWWDESLSLQRVEQPLLDLVRGVLQITDNITSIVTIDQHPFFYFLLQGLLVYGAGTEEFAVRLVSALAAALFVPAIWVLAHWFVRRQLAPPATPTFALILAATSPFLLWFGQEARPYALWATLNALATYLLLRATESPPDLTAGAARRQRWPWVGLVVVDLMLLATHYFSVLMLPFQALVIALWAYRNRHRTAMVGALLLLVAGAIVSLYAAWLLVEQGGGDNFSRVYLAILIPDLVNAFSLGLSVDLGDVWWIDLVFGLLALLGMAWGVRSRRAIAAGGWILPAFLLIALTILLAVNMYHPLYMTARHLSQLLSGFMLLVAIGLGVVWARQRWLATALSIFLLVAIGYSTVNYFTREEYGKDDFPRLGAYMQQRIMPGDLVLYHQPATKRLFDYYVPLASVYAAGARGMNLHIFGAPLLAGDMQHTLDWLAAQAKTHRRIWFMTSGNHAVFDTDGAVETWLLDNFLRVRDAKFFSHSSLHVHLFLPETPVFTELPPDVEHPVTAEFGDLIRLAGYSTEAYQDAFPAPLLLYWQVITKPERRYRYIWNLVEEDASGQRRTLSSVEREPYEGDIPTTFWDPGKVILEYVERPPIVTAPGDGARLFYTLQIYEAETQEKLPVTRLEGGEIDADGVTAIFPAEAP